MSKNNADIRAYIGAPGSGKSVSVKRALKVGRHTRVLIWDRMKEYEEYGSVCKTLSDVLRAARTQNGAWRKKFSVVYQPPPTDQKSREALFDAWCKISLTIGNVCLVAEELSQVTRANGGTPYWGECVLLGRHAGLSILGTSQRPALVDKSFFSSCTLIRCGRLNYDADLKTMGNVLAVNADDIRALRPLDYIERDMSTGKTKKNRIIF